LTACIDITADKVCHLSGYFNADFVRSNTDKEMVWVDEMQIKGICRAGCSHKQDT
jgi:hypothetical protein